MTASQAIERFFEAIAPKATRKRGTPLVEYDWTKHRKALLGLLDAEGVPGLLLLCERLEQPSLSWGRFGRQLLYDEILELLALTPGTEAARGCLELLRRPRVRTIQFEDDGLRPRMVRRRALDLATRQPLEVLEELLASSEAADEEVLALWVQELVVGGLELAGRPAVVSWREGAGHPVASLPLHLHGWERWIAGRVLRPHLTPKARWPSSWSAQAPDLLASVRQSRRDDGWPFLAKTKAPPPGEPCEVELEPVPAPPPWSEPLLDGVAGCWVSKDELVLGPALIARAWTQLAEGGRAAGLGPTKIKSSQVLHFQRLDGAGALDLLFANLAQGGPYEDKLYGAWSRRRAWDLLASGSGEAPGEAIDRIAEGAEGCEWAAFYIKGYHCMDGWDHGLACVRADRRTLLISAGTATD